MFTYKWGVRLHPDISPCAYMRGITVKILADATLPLYYKETWCKKWGGELPRRITQGNYPGELPRGTTQGDYVLGIYNSQIHSQVNYRAILHKTNADDVLLLEPYRPTCRGQARVVLTRHTDCSPFSRLASWLAWDAAWLPCNQLTGKKRNIK